MQNNSNSCDDKSAYRCLCVPASSVGSCGAPSLSAYVCVSLPLSGGSCRAPSLPSGHVIEVTPNPSVGHGQQQGKRQPQPYLILHQKCQLLPKLGPNLDPFQQGLFLL